VSTDNRVTHVTELRWIKRFVFKKDTWK